MSQVENGIVSCSLLLYFLFHFLPSLIAFSQEFSHLEPTDSLISLLLSLYSFAINLSRYYCLVSSTLTAYATQ